MVCEDWEQWGIAVNTAINIHVPSPFWIPFKLLHNQHCPDCSYLVHVYLVQVR